MYKHLRLLPNTISIMAQLNIKIDDEDSELLRIVARTEGIPVSALFRIVINRTFDSWRLEKVFELYSQGKIGLKKAATLSKLTLVEFVNKLEELDLEPPHSKEMEEISERLASQVTRERLLRNP